MIYMKTVCPYCEKKNSFKSNLNIERIECVECNQFFFALPRIFSAFTEYRGIEYEYYLEAMSRGNDPSEYFFRPDVVEWMKEQRKIRRAG